MALYHKYSLGFKFNNELCYKDAVSFHTAFHDGYFLTSRDLFLSNSNI